MLKKDNSNFLQIFKEENGQWSARRVVCFFSLFIASILSFYIVFKGFGIWQCFIPVLAFLTVSVLMLLFTTWADIKECIAAAKGIK